LFHATPAVLNGLLDFASLPPQLLHDSPDSQETRSHGLVDCKPIKIEELLLPPHEIATKQRLKIKPINIDVGNDLSRLFKVSLNGATVVSKTQGDDSLHHYPTIKTHRNIEPLIPCKGDIGQCEDFSVLSSLSLLRADNAVRVVLFSNASILDDGFLSFHYIRKLPVSFRFSTYNVFHAFLTRFLHLRSPCLP
jgi:hypothetical protein